MCQDFNISIQFPSMFYWYFLITIASCYISIFSLSQAKVSRVSALICSKSSSWKLIDEPMNRWIDDCPTIFCRQRRAFCRVADPKSSASQQSDGLKVPFGPTKNNWIESKVGLGRFCCCKALERVWKNSSAGCDHCKNMATGETVPLWGCSCSGNERLACPRMSWSEDVGH